MRIPILILIVLTTFRCARADATLPAEDPTTVQITLHPKSATDTSLKYQLLPQRAELTPGNAAQVYLLAFGKHVQGLGFADFQDMIRAEDKDFPLEKAREFLRQGDAATAMTYLDLAGRRESCLWELPDREQGIESQAFNFLSGSSQWYGGLISLRARVAIVDGNFDQAARALRTGFTMGQNLSRAAPMGQAMGGTYVDSLMLANVRQWVQHRDAPNLYWALVNLPRWTSHLRPVMEAESAMLERTFPGLARAEHLSAGESREVLHRLVLEGGRLSEAEMIVEMMRDYSSVKRRVVEAGLLSAEDAEAAPANSLMLAWYHDEYRRAVNRLGKYLGLSTPQALAGTRQEFETLLGPDRPFNPLMAVIPHYPDAIVRFAMADRRVAMLAILEGISSFAADHEGTLPGSLEQLSPRTPAPTDPLTGRPFEYKTTPDGATLAAPTAPDIRPAQNQVWNISIQH